MLTRRRVLGVALVVCAALGAFMAWQLYGLQRDLSRAEQAADRLRSAIDGDDRASQEKAIADLQDSASSASGRASAFWYDPLTVLPIVGDDAHGVQVLSTTLSDVVDDGVDPLADSVDRLDDVLNNGRVDIEGVRSLQGSVARANDAFAGADDEIEDVDSSGFTGSLQRRFDEYADLVSTASRALASADTATRVLPDMAGANGPRRYLLLFQNNAEIRATGGMPGAWASIRTEDGALEMGRRGTSADFRRKRQLALPLSDAEIAIYGKNFAKLFQRAGSIPDFPRAAAIWQTYWDRRFPGTPIDGIIALDPVGMSYLIEGIGPVRVGDLTLTSENLVDELLRDPYLELEGPAQDRIFARATKAIFDQMTGALSSPLAVVEGLSRAAREGRLLVAPFDEQLKAELEGSHVEGALRTEPTDTPYVDIGVDAANGTKMSYYLRYDAEIESRICPANGQRLEGTMTLHQTISRQEASNLPRYVTGNATEGEQYLEVRIYGPVGGTIEDVSLDGRTQKVDVRRIDDRPVATVSLLIDSRKEREINWFMETGPGQTGEVKLRMTPGILPGPNTRTFPTGCE